MEGFPGTVFAPVAAVGRHRLPGGKVSRDSAPFTALGHHIKDGVEDSPQTRTAGASAGFGSGQKGLE